jgi:hypothetical protein
LAEQWNPVEQVESCVHSVSRQGEDVPGGRRREFVNPQSRSATCLEPSLGDRPGDYLVQGPAIYALDIHSDAASAGQYGNCHQPATVRHRHVQVCTGNLRSPMPTAALGTRTIHRQSRRRDTDVRADGAPQQSCTEQHPGPIRLARAALEPVQLPMVEQAPQPDVGSRQISCEHNDSVLWL